MNHVDLIGRLCADPEVRYTQGNTVTAIARYTLAVERKYNRGSENNADFINIVAFGKSGEFAEKYLKKGMKVAVAGRIQSGSYTDKDGKKVYTTEVVAEDQEFVESKKTSDNTQEAPVINDTAGFMNIPEGVDTDLPFAMPSR